MARLFLVCVLLLIIFPRFLYAQPSIIGELKQDDVRLEKGIFIYKVEIKNPKLFARPDNAGAETIINHKPGNVVKERITIICDNSNFIKKTYNIDNKSLIEEFFDGKYYCIVSHPSESEKGVSARLEFSRDNKNYSLQTRAAGIYPGAMFFQGRGLSYFADQKTSFAKSTLALSVNGLNTNAALNERFGEVATRIEMRGSDNKLYSVFENAKPIRLRNGTWIASFSKHISYDDKRNIVDETTVNFIAEKTLPLGQNYRPNLVKGMVVDVIIDGKTTSFVKDTSTNYTLEQIESLAGKRVDQQQRIDAKIVDAQDQRVAASWFRWAYWILWGVIISATAGLVYLLLARLRKTK